MHDGRIRIVVRVTTVAVVVLVAADLALQSFAWITTGSASDNWDFVLIACGFTLTGALIHTARPGNPNAWLLLGMGTVAAVAGLATAGPLAGELGERIEHSLWWLAYSPLVIVLLLLPDGRPLSRRWRPWMALAVLGVVLPTVGSVVVAITAPGAITGPRAFTPAAVAALVGTVVVVVATVLALGAGIVALVIRWRRSPAESRAAQRWLLVLGTATPLALLLELARVPAGWVLGVVATPLVMLVAALRHRLLDLDLIIDRSVVWIGSTVLVVGGYVGLLWVVSAAVGGSTPGVTVPVVAATAVAALCFAPVRSRVQRGVDRALYGRRDDLAAAFTAVESRLAAAEAPGLVQVAAAAIAETLALPYVAISVAGERGEAASAVFGRPAGEEEQIALVHRGAEIGTVAVTARSRRERVTPQERRVVEVLARTAAIGVRAVELTATLQVAREHLVHAREEERRRLRRDLHDGVGPALVGTRMQALAVLRGLTGTASGAGVAQLERDIGDCVDEVARVVDGLRPPALDEGLAVAIGEVVGRLTANGPRVGFDVDELGPLPAAVEVCLYRIAAEALSNVVRHAGANTCRVDLRRRGEGVALLVVDDGRGPDARTGTSGTGVGVRSMQTRADELGGRCTITAADGGGTRVDVWIPTAPAAPTPHTEAILRELDAAGANSPDRSEQE